MYSLLRRTTLVSALFVSAFGLAGCSSDEDAGPKMDSAPPVVTPGKMDDGMGKMDDGMGKMDGMEKGKMGGMEKGKMGGMEKGKMEAEKGKMEAEKGKMEAEKGKAAEKAKGDAPAK